MGRPQLTDIMSQFRETSFLIETNALIVQHKFSPTEGARTLSFYAEKIGTYDC